MSKKKKMTPEELDDLNEAQMFGAKVWSTESKLGTKKTNPKQCNKRGNIDQTKL